MSATVSSTVPALFIVPTTAVSPSWMLRRVTMPAIGDSMRTLLRSNCALASCARSCPSRTSCVRTCFSRSTRADCAILTSFSARSSASRGVSCCFHSSCWRLRFCCATGQLHARRLDALPRLVERRFGALQRRLAALDARAQRPRIDLHQELSQRHAVAFVDGEIDDASRCVGADVDEPLRLNLARRRDDRLEVARADRLDRDASAPSSGGTTTRIRRRAAMHNRGRPRR